MVHAGINDISEDEYNRLKEKTMAKKKKKAKKKSKKKAKKKKKSYVKFLKRKRMKRNTKGILKILKEKKTVSVQSQNKLESITSPMPDWNWKNSKRKD